LVVGAVVRAITWGDMVEKYQSGRKRSGGSGIVPRAGPEGDGVRDYGAQGEQRRWGLHTAGIAKRVFVCAPPF
jgi:hypothetical protein